MEGDPRRDCLRGVFNRQLHFHAPGDKNSVVRFTQRFSAQIFRGTSFFGTFPARNMKASSTLSVNSYRLALLVRSEHYDLC